MSTLFPISRRGVLSSFDRDFNDIFNSFFESPSFLTSPSRQRSPSFVSTPLANVHKTAEGYTIALAAPGCSRDDFNVDVDNNVLTVSVTNEDEGLRNDSPSTLQEYSYSSFSRSWTLPDGVKLKSIDARYEAGILTLELPVEDEENGKKLIVNVK